MRGERGPKKVFREMRERVNLVKTLNLERPSGIFDIYILYNNITVVNVDSGWLAMLVAGG